MSYYDSDSHKNECDNAEYYYCSTDKVIVHESEKNVCPICLLFIPRFDKVTDCICEELPDYEPDYDWMRKYAMENPEVGVYA